MLDDSQTEPFQGLGQDICDIVSASFPGGSDDLLRVSPATPGASSPGASSHESFGLLPGGLATMNDSVSADLATVSAASVASVSPAAVACC